MHLSGLSIWVNALAAKRDSRVRFVEVICYADHGGLHGCDPLSFTVGVRPYVARAHGQDAARFDHPADGDERLPLGGRDEIDLVLDDSTSDSAGINVEAAYPQALSTIMPTMPA